MLTAQTQARVSLSVAGSLLVVVTRGRIPEHQRRERLSKHA